MTNPDWSWAQAVAALGAIIVVILILRWTSDVIRGQGKQSDTLINRSFDIADRAMGEAERAPVVKVPPVIAAVERPTAIPGGTTGNSQVPATKPTAVKPAASKDGGGSD